MTPGTAREGRAQWHGQQQRLGQLRLRQERQPHRRQRRLSDRRLGTTVFGTKKGRGKRWGTIMPGNSGRSPRHLPPAGEHRAHHARDSRRPTTPPRRALDANGVDLISGTFPFNFAEGSIGSGEAELALLRMVGPATRRQSLVHRSASGTISSSTSAPPPPIRQFRLAKRHVPRRGKPRSRPCGQRRQPPVSLARRHHDQPSPIPMREAATSPISATTAAPRPAAMLVPTSIASPDGRLRPSTWEFWEHCLERQDYPGPDQLPVHAAAGARVEQLRLFGRLRLCVGHGQPGRQPAAVELLPPHRSHLPQQPGREPGAGRRQLFRIPRPGSPRSPTPAGGSGG